jgi:hypothetical protein
MERGLPAFCKELPMKRILVVLLLIVVGVVAYGFYEGWFQFSSEREGDKSTIKLTTDEEKIRKDVGKAEEKIQEAGQAIKEKTGIGTEKGQ